MSEHAIALGVPVVDVVRSGFVESVHSGSLVAVDAAREILFSVGTVDVPVFPRSSNKPMQAVAMLECGVDLYGADLALAAASHSGEPAHVERAAALLAEAGLDEDALDCPADLPMYEPARRAVLMAGGGPRRLLMNCSGKHAAMLLTCVRAGWPTEGYLDQAHPLQKSIRSTVERLSGETVTATGVDGCGAPLMALTLAGLARAVGSLVTAPEGSNERRVADAMRAHPYLVSGTDREDLALMSAVNGMLTKGGAEAVYVAALPDGRAVSLKVDDGDKRACMPLLVAALRKLGVTAPGLDALAEPPVMGGGRQVGVVRIRPGVLD